MELEIELHRRVAAASPHVVQFWAAVDDATHTHILMEWCSGGDLRRAIEGGAFSGERRLRDALCRPLLRVLAALEEQGVVHRDVKPENIFVSDGQVRLGDFGLAVCVAGAGAEAGARRRGSSGSGSASTSGASDGAPPPPSDADDGAGGLAGAGGRSASFASLAALDVPAPQRRAAGTTAYTAPEVLLAALTHASVAEATRPKADVFALGLVALECLTGRHPFVAPDASSGSIVCHALSGEPVPLPARPQQLLAPPAGGGGLTGECLDWLRLCLEKDPARRPAAEELLRHAWMEVELPEAPPAGCLLHGRSASLGGGADTAASKDSSLESAPHAGCWQQQQRHHHQPAKHQLQPQPFESDQPCSEMEAVWLADVGGRRGAPAVAAAAVAAGSLTGGFSSPPRGLLAKSAPESQHASAGGCGGGSCGGGLAGSALLRRAVSARAVWDGPAQPGAGGGLRGASSNRWEHSPPQQQHRNLHTYSANCWEY
jgi:serine/threonine protein kinase